MSKRKPSRRKGHKGKPPQRGGETHGLLPEIGVLTIVDDIEGELIAEPLKWESRKKPPHIVVTESGRSRAAAKGDRVLAKLRKVKPHLYQALVIRVLPSEAPQTVLGVFVATAEGGIIEPVSRKNKESYMVARPDTLNARHGELVAGVTTPGVPSMGMTYAKITERLGRLDAPKAASLIATQMHNLPSLFPEEALEEAAQAAAPKLGGGREDLRNVPLVTIDGEDARDFDDAVFAEPDGNGWHLIVAIADVAHYVPEGSHLDRVALERGNSVYFPDRVIPMLPERLSNGLCSLVPNEDRYCLAVHIWIDAQGNTKRYRFARGLMRSKVRFTYHEIQNTHNGKAMHPYKQSVIDPLYQAYKALAAERDRRGALDLDLPEYKILFDAAGNVAAIAPRERLEAHRLIETYMIAANVAAADFLLKQKIPAIYRVHETPAEEKLNDLRDFLKLSGYSLHVGAGIKAAHFNRVLKASADKPETAMIHTAVLRAQMQAYYSHENLGHFGLSLQKYCHFTSPIRRYSDLVVHRALAAAIDGGARPQSSRLPEIALHISETERRAMMAERDAADRYKVAFMSRHVGDVFPGTINSLNEYGLFVSLRDNGVTGFVPVRNLPGDFFTYDKRHARFRGQRSKQVFALGDPIMIRVQAANAITGSLIFELERAVAPPEAPHKSRHHHKQRNKHRHKNTHRDKDKRDRGRRRR